MTNLQAVMRRLEKKLGFDAEATDHPQGDLKVQGFSIAAFDGTKLAYTSGHGLARVLPSVPMTSDIRMDVLSMSKTITAAAVVRQLLVMPDVRLDSPIGKHLPSWWRVNSDIGNTTFAEVLLHTGGIMGGASDFHQLAATCELPPDATQVGKHNYQNINYSLLRLLLACLVDRDTIETMGTNDDLRSGLDDATAAMYVDYVRENIFKPCGVVYATVGPTPQQHKDPTQAEWYTGNTFVPANQDLQKDPLAFVGSDYWNMSVVDYGRFAAGLTHGAITPDPWPYMTKEGVPGEPTPIYPNAGTHLGVYDFPAPDGTGHYWSHNGGWDGAANTAWMRFPDGSTVVLFANSPTPQEPSRTVLDAYLGF